ncbi:methylated-DNA--[protein]-cysteine S-methyltransferase [Acidisoma cellulosilytica]|uniref:Methylated-DNA--[protein]-cysteine S-methyltransferase n=1 Tax=Acidisoma cellulosilyticum TaxID=2802395 RepID=A0A963Z117_9PROT|nr:methylated-DNA--[protein]-cysteine S-methyltransferase [Acidisoma cellulosilyticum]MCB8880873.1 methylated-DNA--[protein]-cysteine S-methyltransferase [Acidisoma cellulosilyticum]
MPQLSLHTPIGPVTVSAEQEMIVAVDWGWGRDQEPTPVLTEARAWLQDYFDHQIRPMTLPLDPYGTPYRRAVWTAIAGIPPGETWTYAKVAATAGGSPRSIGTAMAHNPIPLLIPCHRVVGSGANGRFTIGGYSGGEGPETKRFLLDLEAQAAPRPGLQQRITL